MHPVVTVYSVFYNREGAVRSSVDSLVNQSYRNLNIVLVDDGSTDRTPDILAEYAGLANVSVILKENDGFVRTLRSSIENDQRTRPSDYIAIHGAGDVSRPMRIESQVDEMERRPELSFVGTRHALVGHLTKNAGDESTYSGLVTLRGCLKDLGWTHGSVMYRQAHYFNVGGYDERMYYCQDWELYVRLLRGGGGTILDKVLYEKVIFSDGASFSPHKATIQREFNTVIRKYGHDTGQLNVKIDELINTLRSGGNHISVEAAPYYRRKVLALLIRGQYQLVVDWGAELSSLPWNKRFTIVCASSIARVASSNTMAGRWACKVVGAASRIYRRRGVIE